MSSQRRTASRRLPYWGECCGCSWTPMRVGKVMVDTLGGQRFPQNVDPGTRLVSLDGVIGVGDDAGTHEAGSALGERVGVLVVDEERVGAANQGGRHGDGGDVVPQSVEAVTLAEGVIAPRPRAVVEPLAVVEDAAAQRLPVSVRRCGDGDVEHGREAGEDAVALDQRDGAE